MSQDTGETTFPPQDFDPTEVEVTAFATFCFCPTPDLDEKDVCRNCGTEWKEST